MSQLEKTVSTDKVACPVQQGPMEGLIIVNGRPQMERVDMPTISFESIEAIMRLTQEK